VADDPDTGGGRLAAAVAELYENAPEDFTPRRGELVAAAREAGDRAAATAIGALRRPTRAAWAVNRLARTDPAAPGKLAELGAALDAAQRAGQAARLRELSAERWALLDGLTAQALTAAGVGDPPPSLREEVGQTLAAALADPGVAADFAAGTLTRAAQWSGFGLVPGAGGAGEDGASGDGAGGDDAGGDLPSAWAAPAARTSARGRATAAGRTAPDVSAPDTAAAETPPPETPAPDAPARAAPARKAGGRTLRAVPSAGRQPTQAERREQEARRRAEEAERHAATARQVAADQAARRREQYAEAERAVTAAAAAAADAGAAEDRLEAEVRALEQRLTPAREELAAARMRARRAEAAERRAAQALERLPRP
jgi:hypothetical protein